MGKCCLAMIVANERPVIERCLDSVKNIIDQICISINSDNDGTEQAIRDWGKRNNMPTIVWHDPWNGYGPNKTRNLLKIHTELETEYIAFLDADEVFITDLEDPESYLSVDGASKLFKEMDSLPDTDVFYMKTHYGNTNYDRWQIIRNNQVWTWRLPYQEYLVGEKSNVRHDLQWVYNLSRKEGHSSRHSISNNVVLLEEWAKENPESSDIPRALFYLGQAYKYSDMTKAIDYLKRRLEYQGWFQERYVACWYLSQIYAKQGNEKENNTWLQRMNEIDPRRLEGFYDLMTITAKTGNRRQALAWALMAPKSRQEPSGCFLLQKNIYKYEFDYQISLIAYYAAIKSRNDTFADTGLFQVGMDAINRCYKHLPENLKNLTNNNIRFYTENLQGALFKNPTSRDPSIPIGGHENTTLMVIDNFYPDPDAVRKYALQMDFHVKGNYPGQRTDPYILPGTKERIERLVGNKIVYWPDTYNGSFQYTLETDSSWIHRDATEWSLLVYLTPDAPVDGGTKTYIHKESGLTRTGGDSKLEAVLNKDTRNFDAWHLVDKIGNLYNRGVLFRGRGSHMSDKYFGTDKDSARLFQTFFFNTEVNY